MKTKIEVESRKEAELIKRGLEDKETRALVKIMGALSVLPSQKAKQRALLYVESLLEENYP